MVVGLFASECGFCLLWGLFRVVGWLFCLVRVSMFVVVRCFCVWFVVSGFSVLEGFRCSSGFVLVF